MVKRPNNLSEAAASQCRVVFSVDRFYVMRFIGYILLLVGFLWLVGWCAGSVRPLLRNIGIEHFQNYPANKTFSGDQVCAAIRSVISEYLDCQHGVILPATLMLVGGVLLDFSGRRRARQPDNKPSA